MANNRQRVDPEPYGKDISEVALFQFVRCLERREETGTKCKKKTIFTNISLVLDVVPQGPREGKETRRRNAGGAGEHVPTDRNGDDQVK